jgi:PKD repeat protein
MKSTIALLYFVTLFIAVSSCKKDPDPASASFTVDKLTAGVGEVVTFTNASTNATDFLWNFGDGSTSTLESPTHTYSETGIFTVSLTASGEGGDDTFTMQITIEGTLTGTWNKDFIFDSDPQVFPGILIIEQQSDHSLEGSFVFDDGSGYTPLSNGSEIDGNDVNILWYLQGTTYLLAFEGTVNSDFDGMEGIFYYSGIRMGTWTAEKVSNETKAAEKNSVVLDRNMLNFTNKIESILKTR